jgi:hypothetical protein
MMQNCIFEEGQIIKFKSNQMAFKNQGEIFFGKF